MYSNRSALKALAAWLEWIADSDPKEHFECHYRMAFEDEAAVLEGKCPSNITLAADESLQTSVILPGPDEFGFELTFIHASDEELEKMAKDR